MKRVLVVLIILLFAVPVLAGHRHLEKEYQAKWCSACGGNLEVYLIDGRRVDCLTDIYAVEVDFGKKAFEGIGQALHYARLTGKRPGVVYILETQEDRKAVNDVLETCEKYGITVWTMTPEDLE